MLFFFPGMSSAIQGQSLVGASRAGAAISAVLFVICVSLLIVIYRQRKTIRILRITISQNWLAHYPLPS